MGLRKPFILLLLLSPCLDAQPEVRNPIRSPLYLDISNNQFHGPLPSLPPHITFFSASNNNFTGEIPSSICSATNLNFLDLSNNSLTGSLPPCITKLSTSLSVLNLRMNKIGGIIPEIFGGGSPLRTLDLSQNSFEGSLPQSLESCKKLEVLDLSNNRINGTFPNWVAMLPELQVLVLRSNKFNGMLNFPDELKPFSKLRILDLSENDFSGLLQGRYFTNLKAMMSDWQAMPYQESSGGGLAYSDSVSVSVSVIVRMKGVEFDIKLVRIFSIFLTFIDLSSNNFRGPVPAEIGNLKSLKGLNLSHNSLTGSIPLSLGYLTNLESLDLSVNKLDGVIPKQLADLTSLSCLNLSENRLEGAIPSGRQFNTFGNSSFDGNPGLCGFPLPNCFGERPASSPDQESHRDQEEWMSWWRMVLIGYGPGLVLGISLGYIFLETGSPTWLMRFVYRIEAKVTKMSTRKARSSWK